MATEAPREIGPYRLEEKLGAGGMGVVYKAVDTLLDRTVAIKMMHARELLGDDVNLPEVQARFLREAKAAARIKSRHVAQVLQLGTTDDGEAYIVMEYLQGKALSRVITKGGQMPAARVVHIARQLCRGMQSAHDLGVVHRDLKPANVMLVTEDGDDDFVKILDFGVAKLTNDTGAQGLTQTGALLGTLPFMAPEQISGQHIDARTDIYALGIILYRMFTGLSVWDADSLSDIVRHQLSSTPPSMFERVTNATFSPALDSAVLRCLAKDPAARWQSMRELAEALEAGLGEPSATALRPSSWLSSSSSASSSSAMHDPPSSSSSRTARAGNNSNPGTLPTGNGSNSLASIVTGPLQVPGDTDVFSDGATMNAFAEAATATRAPAAVTRSLPGVPAPAPPVSAPSPSRSLAPAPPVSSSGGLKIAVAAAAAIVVVVGSAVAFAVSSASPAPTVTTTTVAPPPPSEPPSLPAPPPPTAGAVASDEPATAGGAVASPTLTAPTPPTLPPPTPPPSSQTAPTAPTPPSPPVAPTKPKVAKPKAEPVDDGDDKDGFVRVRTKQEQ